MCAFCFFSVFPSLEILNLCCEIDPRSCFVGRACPPALLPPHFVCCFFFFLRVQIQSCEVSVWWRNLFNCVA